MRAGRLARILDSVDPDLEVQFSVDDPETRENRPAVFGRVEMGETYMGIRVAMGYGPAVYVRRFAINDEESAGEDA